MIDSVSGSKTSNKMGAVERDGNGHSELFREINVCLDRACAVDAVDTNEAGCATAIAGAGAGRVKADYIADIAASAAIAKAEAAAALLMTASLMTKMAETFVVAGSCCGVVGAASSKRVESAMASGASATATPIPRGIALNNHSFAGVGANGCNSPKQDTIFVMVSNNMKAKTTAAITVAAAIVKTEAATASSTTASWTAKTATAAVDASSCCIGGAKNRNTIESSMASGPLTTATLMTKWITTNYPNFADVRVNGGSSYRQANIIADHQNSNNKEEKVVRATCNDDSDNNEEWNEDDFAAIDLWVTTRQSQSQHQQQHPTSAMTASIDPDSAALLLLDNIGGNDCDEESWNDDDLAAIDLSMAALMQQ